MAEAILTAAAGLGLGGLATGALFLTRHAGDAWKGPALLTAVLAAVATAGIFLGDWFRLTVRTDAGGTPSATVVGAGIGLGWWFLFTATVTTAAGGALFWWRDRRASTPEAIDPGRPLGAADLRQAKEDGDCWLLVTGAPGAGKTALIERMVAQAHRSLRLAAPPRQGAHRDLRATELSTRQADGSARRLRLWEHTWDEGLPAQPASGDIDGVALVIDGTGVRGTADRFPPAVRTGDAIDANARALAVAEWLPRGRPVWLVVTKADLLRLSIHPALMERLKVGPDWDDQLRAFDPVRRSELARDLGVAEQGGDTATDGTAPFERGQGSPFLAYAGRGDTGEGAFGGAELLRTIVGTLAPDMMKEQAIGH